MHASHFYFSCIRGERSDQSYSAIIGFSFYLVVAVFFRADSELNPITISIYSWELKEHSRDCRSNGVNSGERSDHSYSAIIGFYFYLVVAVLFFVTFFITEIEKCGIEPDNNFYLQWGIKGAFERL